MTNPDPVLEEGFARRPSGLILPPLGANPDFRVIQGSPCNSLIAPYIAIIVNDARAHANSIYRGSDAEWILNRHHKLSQAQLFEAWVAWRDHGVLLFGFTRDNPPNPANSSGHSTHDLHSDAVAYPDVPYGHPLERWQQGFDVNDDETDEVIRQAARHGWKVFRPYPTTSEHHHLNFRERPRPTVHTVARIIRLRATLPRS